MVVNSCVVNTYVFLICIITVLMKVLTDTISPINYNFFLLLSGNDFLKGNYRIYLTILISRLLICRQNITFLSYGLNNEVMIIETDKVNHLRN